MPKNSIRIDDFSDGQQPDTEFPDLPAWYKLKNVWLDSSKKLHGRPHLVKASETYTNIQGLAYSHNNELICVADGIVYVNSQPVFTISGSGRVRHDVSRDRTIVTAGSTPIVIGESATYSLPTSINNVTGVASFVGAAKFRLCFVRSDDPRTVWVTTIGNLTDIGTAITDPTSLGINDEWTEAGPIKNLPYVIYDIAELNGRILVFCERSIYMVTPGYSEEGFDAEVMKVGDHEILNVPIVKQQGQIWFMTPYGPYRIFFQEGFPSISPIPMIGIERTILNNVIENECRIGVDTSRSLFFLKPKNSGPSYVSHLGHNGIWTEWDIPFIDIVEAGNKLYGCMVGDPHVYRFDDTATTDNPYEIILQTGLTDFGLTPPVRKRIKSVNIKFSTNAQVQGFTDAYATELPPPSAPIIYGNLETNIKQLESEIGVQGELLSLLIAFRTYGKFDLKSLFLKIFIKRIRSK